MWCLQSLEWRAISRRHQRSVALSRAISTRAGTSAFLPDRALVEAVHGHRPLEVKHGVSMTEVGVCGRVLWCLLSRCVRNKQRSVGESVSCTGRSYKNGGALVQKGSAPGSGALPFWCSIQRLNQPWDTAGWSITF
jgi:hypothetical protein